MFSLLDDPFADDDAKEEDGDRGVQVDRREGRGVGVGRGHDGAGEGRGAGVAARGRQVVGARAAANARWGQTFLAECFLLEKKWWKIRKKNQEVLRARRVDRNFFKANL